MSLVKEELDIKIEEGCYIRPILVSHYQGIFASENPQESGGASSSQAEDCSKIEEEKIELSPPHNAKEERGKSEAKNDLNLAHISEDDSESEFYEIEGDETSKVTPKVRIDPAETKENLAEGNLSCKDCHRPFISKKSMILHKDITNGKCQELGINWKTMSCTLCNEKFNSKESAIRHPGRRHEIYAKKRNGGSKENHDCDICGKQINYRVSNGY